MAVESWLPGADVVNLYPSRGNGKFGNLLGVILHVNEDENGTTDAFFAAGPPTNPQYVTPNFQVYKDGTIHQYLPLDWQPWCQAAGNANYAAIETAGLATEPLTDAQVQACAQIMAAYHEQLQVPLVLADAPGQRGLGTHKMGGGAWGGHDCPGPLRTAQRADILRLAAGGDTMSAPQMQQLTDQLAAIKAGLDALTAAFAALPHDVWAYDQGGKTSQAWAMIQDAAKHSPPPAS